MQRTRVDRNGRVLIPAAVRRALGLRDGSELLVTLEQDSRVVLVSPATAWAQVQELGDAASPPASVVEELLRERRSEAGREDTGDPVDDLLGG